MGSAAACSENGSACDAPAGASRRDSTEAALEKRSSVAHSAARWVTMGWRNSACSCTCVPESERESQGGQLGKQASSPLARPATHLAEAQRSTGD